MMKILLLIFFSFNLSLVRGVSQNDSEVSISNSNRSKTETINSIEYPLNIATNECKTGKNTFYCCIGIDEEEIHFKAIICIDLIYLSEEYGIDVKVTINNVTMIEFRTSVRNPPPICFGSEFTMDIASFCLTFYDLDESKNHLSGCSKFQIYVKKLIKVLEYKLGCFNIPLKQESSAVVLQLLTPHAENDKWLKPVRKLEPTAGVTDIGKIRTSRHITHQSVEEIIAYELL